MMPLFLANVAGWIYENRALVFYSTLGVFVLILVGWGFSKCGAKREVRIDETQIQKVNSENERTRRQELEKIVTENADAVSTVDERNRIADVNRIEREAAIDEKVKVADRAIEDARRQGRDVTADELRCLLVPENCK